MAEGSDFTETLENLVTCAICCDILENPKTLPCLHTLCFKCIQDWNKTCKNNRRRFSCPSCKALVNIPEGDVVSLPTSFHHNSLIQFYNTFKNQACNSQQLQDCSGCSNRRVAVGFCFQCQGIVCNDCYNAHKTVNALKDNHQATLWNEFNKDSINSYIENKAFCPETFHSKNLLEYYCQTCKKSICQKCTVTSHTTHDKISIEEAAQSAKDRLMNEYARVDQVVETRKKELQVIQKNNQRLQEKVHEEIAKLHDDFADKVKLLQDKQNAMIAELNDKLETKLKENNEKENRLRSALQEATKMRDQCKTMTNMNWKHFLLEGYEKLEEVCKATVKDEPILSTSPVQAFSILYIPNPEAPRLLKDLELGKIKESVTDSSRCTIECVQPTRCGFINQFSIVTRDSKGDVCYTDKALIDVNIQDNDGNDVQKEITESQPGQFTVKFRVEKVLPYNIAVSIGGKNIKNSPQTISVIDAKAEFKPVRFFKTTRSSNALSLAMNSKGDIAVVNNNGKGEGRIVIYSADGEYVRDFGDTGAVRSQLNDPYGLAFTNDDHILVSHNTYYGGYIKEYHIDGRLLRTVHKQTGMAFTRMCTLEQSIACLSYNRKSKETSIMFFSKETGDHLQDIKLLAPRIKANPMYITYDNNKYFVSFVRVHSIYVFDENGGLLYTIGEEGDKDGQFNGPRGLAVFGADMLLACDTWNHRVQLFHQDGVFIRSLGTHGSDLGQMDWPVDVAVTPDGHVFVLEFLGRRIQVFR